MADGFIGEIRIFPFGYAPIGWFLCDGQKMALNRYQALYSLLGRRFGGDNQTYFNLPNLNGRIPVDAGVSPTTGTQFVFARAIGEETVTVTYPQAPSHTHSFTTKVSGASSAGMTGVAGTIASSNAGASLLSRGMTSLPKPIFAYDVPPLNNETQLGVNVSPAYGNAQLNADSHSNLQPYLVMAYYICNEGDYPVNPN
ncbi:phage tail protein [Magnetospirillum molischianum]|uniref:Putative Microcystin-dependent protein n=1 Tax=Magnetospirillum molischianum DSM 120 TaxID=1150626 RepID=H8FQD9_MAGML|nr:tail fiber protein [Magnetospirillum molischianum]CCG40577.1 putative Microcystin-dependent protein [Magnetospirillum molischianum DSM 120]